jgi:hypothetical protein
MYYFAWATPIYEGKLKSFHTAELPLAVRLVLNPEAEGLSKQIAGAWAAFARTGTRTTRGYRIGKNTQLARRQPWCSTLARPLSLIGPAKRNLRFSRLLRRARFEKNFSRPIRWQHKFVPSSTE